MYSTESGGARNTASGDNATVPGGYGNLAGGQNSFAAGEDAFATNQNSFVWSDGSAQTSDSNTNQFVARASGGFVFYTSATNTGVMLPPGSGSWSTLSDRNAKDNFAAVDSETMLAKVASLPMTTWSYKTEPGVRHIGPMAQDFYAAFKVGEDDKHIADVDEGGVALAAVQGLNRKVDSEDSALRAQNARLQREVEHLRQIVTQLSQKLNDSPPAAAGRPDTAFTD
jgi:trimeric autotransporter adhesin